MLCSRRVSLLLILTLGLFLVGILPLALTEEATKVQIGAVAPDFSLPDLSGKMHRLSSYRGKIVLLEWTNPHCPFVVRHYQEKIMTSLQKKYGEKGVVWLTINSTNPEHENFEPAEKLKEIYGGWGAAYTALLMDPEGKVGKNYDALTTPHMFIINSEGILVYNGAIDDDPRGNKPDRVNYVEAALSEIFAGKNVSVTTTKPYGCTIKYAK